MYESPWLNLTLYPDEVDYPRARPLGDHWLNLQSSVRTTDAPWELPPVLAEREGPLVYLSLGSLGSADVELMQRLVDTLADAPWRVIVSKGPQHELLRLPDTMAGEEFLPQTSILPQVDAVITHGGNNTVTECLHFGRPMVVLPLFWDQYDNAQRIQETGFGLRLDTYGHAPEELLARSTPARRPRGARAGSPRRRRGCRPTAARSAPRSAIEAVAAAGEVNCGWVGVGFGRACDEFDLETMRSTRPHPAYVGASRAANRGAAAALVTPRGAVRHERAATATESCPAPRRRSSSPARPSPSSSPARPGRSPGS